ncbi:MAG: transglutaminase family protein [Acidobacteriaceae bacterium]|nr:transglutaminase family protein [Acidobacteriaceae bacterium]MBV9779953.1 transglutaminase family protein [Acidobacteriaceae bacterium]
MFYAIRHFTRYRYSRPIWQSMMEVRMHPRSEHMQRCFTFQLSVSPRARIFSYADHLGNLVHHFDIPEQHNQLTIVADALVDVDAPEPLPTALGSEAWSEIDDIIDREDYWDMLMPSHFARTSPELEALAAEFGVDKRNGHDPLQLLMTVNSRLYEGFSYVKKSTSVDSPIEDALRSRQGVCQDFAHIMIALVRNLRIPCRYVSGYLHHDASHIDRSAEGATHAWVEALLPGLGWMGFDPTNNLIAGGRHIRTAIGRDYADVPPTVGTMKGSADTELQVRVRVTPSEAVLPPDQEFAADEEWSRFLETNQEAEVQQGQQQQ